MPAALARLRAYLAATPPTGPADWEREGLPLSVYGAVPRLAGGPAPPVPPGVGWDDPLDRPGPQPENAGLTPGWPPAPAPAPPPELAAAVGELAHAARVAERVGAAARKADKRAWELGQWVDDLERQVEVLGRELERLRGEVQRTPGPGAGGPRRGPAGAAVAAPA